MSIAFTSFKHPKLQISIKIPVTLLQIVYICMTAISMNYLFANLLVAWLQIVRYRFILKYSCQMKWGILLNKWTWW